MAYKDLQIQILEDVAALTRTDRYADFTEHYSVGKNSRHYQYATGGTHDRDLQSRIEEYLTPRTHTNVRDLCRELEIPLTKASRSVIGQVLLRAGWAKQRGQRIAGTTQNHWSRPDVTPLRPTLPGVVSVLSVEEAVLTSGEVCDRLGLPTTQSNKATAGRLLAKLGWKRRQFGEDRKQRWEKVS